MASQGLPAERLREYLQDLNPEARALLVRELERGSLRGLQVPGADLIVEALRPTFRKGTNQPARIGNPARLFFQPLEPFLVDSGPRVELPGRIERASLAPLWEWISRDLLAGEAQAYSEQATAALLAEDETRAGVLAHAFQDRVAAVITERLALAQQDERIRRRMLGQIALPRAIADLQTLHGALVHRDVFARLAARLPAIVSNLGEDQTANVAALVRQCSASQSDLLLPALVVVMNRLGARWQLIRLAIHAGDSDVAARVMQSPLALAVTLVFADIRCDIEMLRACLRRGAVAEAIGLCKELHDAFRAVRTEMNLAGDTAWSRELAGLRADVAGLLGSEIEATPGMVRRLLRIRPAKEVASGAALDPADVAEAEAHIELTCAGRNYAGELAINQVAPRVVIELQSYLDTGMPALLDALRAAGPGERKFRQSQVDAAVRLAGKLFGAEYGGLLAKAAGMAAAERKPAKA
jgi:hypothetical protein